MLCLIKSWFVYLILFNFCFTLLCFKMFCMVLLESTILFWTKKTLWNNIPLKAKKALHLLTWDCSVSNPFSKEIYLSQLSSSFSPFLISQGSPCNSLLTAISSTEYLLNILQSTSYVLVLEALRKKIWKRRYFFLKAEATQANI